MTGVVDRIVNLLKWPMGPLFVAKAVFPPDGLSNRNKICRILRFVYSLRQKFAGQ